MMYKEIIGDLFSVSSEYCIAHCISADCVLEKGVAKEINARFHVRQVLTSHINGCMEMWNRLSDNEKGFCIRVGRILNLVTKQYYYQKPTYRTLYCALYRMRSLCLNIGINKIAMPTIACGLDRLDWGRVSQMIQEIFNDTDIEILVVKTS